MADNKRLKFDAEIIDYKSYATKDYLELSMRPISSVNPNNNNSWFTPESLQDAVEVGTFKNKPILGYFENDDFVSHNGAWKKDAETGVDYWDTLGSQGERILGVVRSEDPVEVVKESDGLSWIHLDCVLWVQYCFKQVKRLLKDAVKAKNNGGTTKNVSVEVDIIDYEKLDNGVLKINKFNLVGITILGSRKGKKVEPGIDNADLSVVDFMGRETYDKQMKGLRLAYEKLEGSSTQENKEEFIKMAENENEKIIEPQNSDLGVQNEEPQKFEEEGSGCEQGENAAEVPATYEDGHEGCGEEDHGEGEDNGNEGGDDHDDDHDDHDDGEDEHEDEGCHSNNAEGEEICPECGEEPCECEEHENEGCHEDEGCKAQEDCGESPLEGDPDREDEGCKAQEEYEKQKAEMLSLTAKYEDLVKENQSLQEENASLKDRVAVYEHKEFLEQASLLIASAADLTEEQAKGFYASCEKKEISNLDELKSKVAIAVFEAVKKPVELIKPISFEADIEVPQTLIEDTKAPKLSRWERMKKNVAKN